MKIKEARNIVRKMIQWAMLAQGVPLDERPGLITEDLPTLLKANKMVEAANKRAQKRIDNIVKEKGGWEGKRSVQMTIAERGIAALYVAANFPGDIPGNTDVLAMHNNNIVVCLDKRYLQNEDEEE